RGKLQRHGFPAEKFDIQRRILAKMCPQIAAYTAGTYYTDTITLASCCQLAIVILSPLLWLHLRSCERVIIYALCVKYRQSERLIPVPDQHLTLGHIA